MYEKISDDKRTNQVRPTTVILVRHGETEANVQQIWHGALDAPLTARGQRQVEATGHGVAELSRRFPIDRFFVSPAPRTQSTAAAISAATHMTPEIREGLREFDLGDWEGRTFADLHDNENLWGRWEVEPAFAPPNGESPQSFNRRAVETVQTLADQYPGETLLLVTHGGVICNVLATWIGDGPQDWQSWDPHNCAISMLQLDGDAWRAVMVNDISHLPANTVAAQTPEYTGEAQAG